jgi:uncharacterized membrane protein (DUF106 family)
MIILDFIFGWLLRLPSDLTIIVIAVLTGVTLTLVRKWTTNQDLLARAAADNQRLAILIKEAKRAGSKETVARYRLTKAQVGMLKFKQEGKPMLVSLLPIALLATWAFARLEFLPPQPGETVTAVAHAPLSAVGEIVHLVPIPGVTATDGWVKQLTVTGNDASANWQLRFDSVVDPGQVVARRTAGAVQLELQLRERRLFGIVPGWSNIGLPAWLVGYLLIVIPFVPLLKKLLKIH